MGLEQLKARRFAPDAVVFMPMDQPAQKRLVQPRHIWTAAIAVMVLMIGGYVYFQFGLARHVTVDAGRLTISTVERDVFHEYIPASGTVQPQKTVFLDIDQGGQVAERLVEEGAMVQAGQPLVRLRNASLELQVRGQEAQLAEQLFQLTSINLQLRETRLQRARDLNDIDYKIVDLTQQLGRRNRLAAEGFAKRADVEDLQADLTRYRRQRDTVTAALDLDQHTAVDQAKQMHEAITLLQQNLVTAHGTLDALVIRAPIAGQLTTLDADAGAYKAPGQRIGQIDRTDAYKITGLIDEFYLGRVAPGESATGEIDGTTYKMQVGRVHPEVKDRQFAVDLSFNGTMPRMLRRGQTVQLRLEIGSAKDSLVAANGAFYDDTGGHWALVLTPSGSQAVRRPVTLGRRNTDAIEVLSGLHAGDRLITSSYADYQNIDRIDLRPAAAAAN